VHGKFRWLCCLRRGSILAIPSRSLGQDVLQVRHGQGPDCPTKKAVDFSDMQDGESPSANAVQYPEITTTAPRTSADPSSSSQSTPRLPSIRTSNRLTSHSRPSRLGRKRAEPLLPSGQKHSLSPGPEPEGVDTISWGRLRVQSYLLGGWHTSGGPQGPWAGRGRHGGLAATGWSPLWRWFGGARVCCSPCSALCCALSPGQAVGPRLGAQGCRAEDPFDELGKVLRGDYAS